MSEASANALRWARMGDNLDVLLRDIALENGQDAADALAYAVVCDREVSTWRRPRLAGTNPAPSCGVLDPVQNYRTEALAWATAHSHAELVELLERIHAAS